MSEDRNATFSVAMVAVPVLVGDVADRGGLGLGPAEDLEGGQAGDHVEEVAGQAVEKARLAAPSGPRSRRPPAP